MNLNALKTSSLKIDPKSYDKSPLLQPKEIISCFIHITYRERVIHFHFSAVLVYPSFLSSSFHPPTSLSNPYFLLNFGLAKYRLNNPPIQLYYFHILLCFGYKNSHSRNWQILPNDSNWSEGFISPSLYSFQLCSFVEPTGLGRFNHSFQGKRHLLEYLRISLVQTY